MLCQGPGEGCCSHCFPSVDPTRPVQASGLRQTGGEVTEPWARRNCTDSSAAGAPRLPLPGHGLACCGPQTTQGQRPRPELPSFL